MSEFYSIKQGILSLQEDYNVDDGYIVYVCDSGGVERCFSFVDLASAGEAIDERLIHWRYYLSIKLLRVEHAVVSSIIWCCSGVFYTWRW